MTSKLLIIPVMIVCFLKGIWGNWIHSNYLLSMVDLGILITNARVEIGSNHIDN
jgi:hypothetical protein